MQSELYELSCVVLILPIHFELICDIVLEFLKKKQNNIDKNTMSLIIKDIPIDLEIVDSCFHPESNDRNIRQNDKDQYQIFLYLEGLDLFHIDNVIYYFPALNKKIEIKRSIYNKNCLFTFWTKYIFTVVGTINSKLYDWERPLKIEHKLQYDKTCFRKNQYTLIKE